MSETHDSDRLRELKAEQNHFGCPMCGKNGVDVNSVHLFECRECNTQFDEAKRGDREVKIIEIPTGPKKSHLLPVAVVSEIGEGRFPVDEQIALLEHQTKGELHRIIKT